MWAWHLQEMLISLYWTWPFCRIDATGPVFFLEFAFSFDFCYISLFLFLSHSSKKWFLEPSFSLSIEKMLEMCVFYSSSILLFYSSLIIWLNLMVSTINNMLTGLNSIFLGQIFLELLIHKSVYCTSSTEWPNKCFKLKVSKTKLPILQNSSISDIPVVFK